MTYNDLALDHYNHPRNVGALDKEDRRVGTGSSGAPDEGVSLRIQIQVDSQTDRIEDARFKAFGCIWAIAACSFLTEWTKGRSVEQAADGAQAAIREGLRLPPDRQRYAALAAEALRAAIRDWEERRASRSSRRSTLDA